MTTYKELAQFLRRTAVVHDSYDKRMLHAAASVLESIEPPSVQMTPFGSLLRMWNTNHLTAEQWVEIGETMKAMAMVCAESVAGEPKP